MRTQHPTEPRLSVRYFVLVDDDVVKVAQRVMRDFYFNRKAVLQRYAGQTIDIATVAIILQNRLPKEIDQISCMRCKVTPAGALDEIYDFEHGRYMSYKLSKAQAITSGTVIDASEIFNQKRLKHKYEQKLSPIHLKKILGIIFK